MIQNQRFSGNNTQFDNNECVYLFIYDFSISIEFKKKIGQSNNFHKMYVLIYFS